MPVLTCIVPSSFFIRATILIGIAQIILAFKQLQAVLIVTVYAFENIMTCRVHRAVVLGLIADAQHQPKTSQLPFTLATGITGTSEFEVDMAFQGKDVSDDKYRKGQAASGSSYDRR